MSLVLNKLEKTPTQLNFERIKQEKAEKAEKTLKY